MNYEIRLHSNPNSLELAVFIRGLGPSGELEEVCTDLVMKSVSDHHVGDILPYLPLSLTPNAAERLMEDLVKAGVRKPVEVHENVEATLREHISYLQGLVTKLSTKESCP